MLLSKVQTASRDDEAVLYSVKELHSKINPSTSVSDPLPNKLFNFGDFDFVLKVKMGQSKKKKVKMGN